MPYELTGARGNVLIFRVTGLLKKSELDRVNRQTLSEIRRLEKIRSLILIEDFHGWDNKDEWGDMSFLKYDQHIQMVALVGAEKWKDLALAFMGKGLRPFEIRYFLPGELALAKAWIGIKPD